MLLVCALLFVCVLSIHSRQSNWSWKQSYNRHSLFLSSLSLSLVSLWSLSYTQSYHSICFIATENSSGFKLCCMELMQHNHIHSIRWPFTHPFACKHIHIQLTIRSYHRHMLSYHYICLLSSRFWHHQYTSAWRGGDLRLDEGLQIFGVESHQCMSGEGQRAFQWQSAFVSDWSNNDTNTSHILLSDQSNNDTNTSHTLLSNWSHNDTNASHILLSDQSNNDTNTSHTLLSDWSNNDTNTSHMLLSDWSSNLTNTSHTLLTGPTMTSMYFTDWSNNNFNVFHWLVQQ